MYIIYYEIIFYTQFFTPVEKIKNYLFSLTKKYFPLIEFPSEINLIPIYPFIDDNPKIHQIKPQISKENNVKNFFFFFGFKMI